MRFVKIGITFFNISLIVIGFLGFLSVGGSQVMPSQTLCAATPNLSTGINCIPNVADCPGGKNLLNDPGISSLLKGNLTLDNLQQSILETTKRTRPNGFVIPGDYNTIKDRICVSNDVVSIIPAYKGNILGSGDLDTDLTAYFGDTLVFSIPRICYGDVNMASQAPNGQSGYANPWGCCPGPESGYRYQFLMSEGNRSGLSGGPLNLSHAFDVGSKDKNYTACCPAVDGKAPAHYYHEAFGDKQAGCLDANFNLIAAIGDVRIVNTTNQPSLWGGGMNFSGFVSQGSAEGSTNVCPAGLTCGVTEDGRIVKADEFRENTGMKCAKCYADGEAIKLGTDGKSLIRCSATEENPSGQPVDEIGLCNASASDTIACLSGGKATNPDGTPNQNYTLCCNCRTRGGVWTGIGCTDTTPLGIITGLIRIVFGVVGGIALVQLIIAGIMYQTGDEARIKAARESIIKTLTGLAVLVFSVLILRIIGINILDILPVGSV